MLKRLHDKLTQSRTSHLCCILLVRSRRGSSSLRAEDRKTASTRGGVRAPLRVRRAHGLVGFQMNNLESHVENSG